MGHGWHAKGEGCTTCDKRRESMNRRYAEDPEFREARKAYANSRPGRRPLNRLVNCPRCGTPFTRKGNQRYCTPTCAGPDNRPAKPIYRTPAHRAARKAWKRTIDSNGGWTCHFCGEWIHPTDRWHLDHLPGTAQYRGPAHASCNSRDGAERSPYAKRYAKKPPSF